MSPIGSMDRLSILLLLLICVTVSSLPTSEEEAKQAKIKDVSSVRSRFSFRELINFDNYLKAFGKRYPSVLERMARMKTYLANAFKSFASLIAYKNHVSPSYLGINQMSDWTKDEVNSMYFDGSKIVEGDHKGKDFEEIELEETNATNEGAKGRSKREVVNGPKESYDEEKKTDVGAGGTILDFLPNGGFSIKNLLSLRSLNLNFSQFAHPMHEPDEVFVDYRETGCITPVRDQGLCGSCYAFSTIAMYEWLFCNQTGIKAEFSEQYMVDCGHRTGLKGCSGAMIPDCGKFVKNFGLEMRENYPYNARENSCPFEEELDGRRLGFVRLHEGDLEELTPSSNELALNYGPLMTIVAVNPSFHQYGGGVDDAIACDRKEAHAMLIVGRGREDGKDYWLYKNSFGPDWGEKGYYKMNRFNNCTLDGGSGYIARVKFLKANTGLDHFKFFPNPYHYLHSYTRRNV